MYMGPPKNNKNENVELRYCYICDRYLKEGVYRFNDSYCPNLPSNIDDTDTCVEVGRKINKARSKVFMELSEKYKITMDEEWNNLKKKDKIQLERDLGITLKEFSNMTVKESIKMMSKNKKILDVYTNFRKHRLAIMNMYKTSVDLASCGRER